MPPSVVFSTPLLLATLLTLPSALAEETVPVALQRAAAIAPGAAASASPDARFAVGELLAHDAFADGLALWRTELEKGGTVAAREGVLEIDVPGGCTVWLASPLSGPVLMASFIAFRYGLKMAPVSYAVPVRQVSILVGVLLGMIFLGESYGKIRLASALLILAGALLIKLG